MSFLMFTMGVCSRLCSKLKNRFLSSRGRIVNDSNLESVSKDNLLNRFGLCKTLKSASYSCGSRDLRDRVSCGSNLLHHSIGGISDTKLIKVAVVGTPNAGKSTLINGLVKRRVCSISRKVHTTRTKTEAILTKGNIQVIFFDTPGLVDVYNSKRHNLERSFLVDAELCIKESDVVAVIHDVSNIWTRDRLDLKILRLLHLYQEKSSVLILNKVDALKSKRKLLDLATSLTCGSLEDDISETVDTVVINGGQDSTAPESRKINKFSEKTVRKTVINEIGWPHFEGVFMTSALTGSGIDATREFMLQKAIPRPWIYPLSVFTDQKMEEIIILAVKEKLLEHLPKEIPYGIRTVLEHLSISPAGDVIAVVLLNCNHLRIQKMLIGSSGKKIREIARAAEKALENTFMENVKLKIVVQIKK